MNCQEVEKIIPDLGRGAVAHELALAHLKECRSCGERFADEERLTAGLLALARSSAQEQAPELIEARLLREFRSREIAARRPRRWLSLAAIGSIAATVILVKLFAPANPQPKAATIIEKPHVAAQAAPVPVESPVAAPPHRKITRTRRVARPVRPPEPVQMGAEFLPVAQGDAWTPLDGGRLVRVSLPRSALRSFGLPIDEERAMEPVQADVMLSNDGLLRAIRFVH